MTTPRAVERRLDAVERRLPGDGGSLTAAERLELERLEHELAARPPIDKWPVEELNRYLAAGGNPDGTAQQLDALRRRARSPQEIARAAAVARLIAGMSLDELDDLIAAGGAGF